MSRYVVTVIIIAFVVGIVCGYMLAKTKMEHVELTSFGNNSSGFHPIIPTWEFEQHGDTVYEIRVDTLYFNNGKPALVTKVHPTRGIGINFLIGDSSIITGLPDSLDFTFYPFDTTITKHIKSSKYPKRKY